MSFAQLEPMYRSSVIPSSSTINITESLLPTKDEVIVRVAKLEILKSDLSSLKGNNWLTDTIIEAYFASISGPEVYVCCQTFARMENQFQS